MADILLLGGGGHCKSVIDSIIQTNKFNIVGILDKSGKIGSTVNGVKIVGDDHNMISYYQQGIKNVFITVGSIGDTFLRLKLQKKAKEIGFEFPTIIDPTAIISSNAKIGEGTFVGKGSIINTDVSVGEFCIINTGVIVEHDCQIEEFCHIAPGTTLSGGVKIGSKSHIGTNSTVIQNIEIGSHTLIGAGSVVIKDIGNNKRAYGNPCKVV